MACAGCALDPKDVPKAVDSAIMLLRFLEAVSSQYIIANAINEGKELKDISVAILICIIANDGIADKSYELAYGVASNKLSYIVGQLIFIGLVGTFTGVQFKDEKPISGFGPPLLFIGFNFIQICVCLVCDDRPCNGADAINALAGPIVQYTLFGVAFVWVPWKLIKPNTPRDEIFGWVLLASFCTACAVSCCIMIFGMCIVAAFGLSK